MGSFSERGVRIEFMRMPPGATWISADDRARRLFVVLSCDGAAVGESATRLSALQLQSGETLELSATTEMTLFVIGCRRIESACGARDEGFKTRNG
jgi:hypothetical protein